MSKLIHEELSNKVVGAALTVHKVLGPGLLESAYEGALAVELNYLGIPYERQRVFPLVYRGEYIGVYIADLVVDNTIILELKSVNRIAEVMEGQCINYLILSRLPIAYLMNFHNLRLEWRRFINTK